MALQVLENPTGVVDGINTVYTTAQDIYQILEVIVDGVTYLGSISITAHNQFTLGNAPQYYVYITYFDSVPVNPPYTGPAIPLAEAYQALKNQLKDISDVPQATFIQWCEYINDFTYRYLLGVDPDRFTKTTSLSVINGQSTYSIPSDFRDQSAWNTGLFITDNNGYTTSQRLPLSGPGQGFPGYFISRGNLILTPTPAENATLAWIYTVKNGRLSTIDQYFTMDGTANGIPIIELEYLLYVTRALACQYQIWDQEIGEESFADQRFQRALSELCENIRRQPSAMGLLDQSQMYGSGSTAGGWGNGLGFWG